jgi:nucleotide-binding universal stress UspA family protein
MKKILFPTDFSKVSLNAFSYALRFAAKIDAEIVTLHVYELPPATAIENYDFLLNTYNITELSEFENYKSEVPKLRKIAKKLDMEHIPLCHVLQQGNAETEIVKAIKNEKPDYIIMGTKGASGFKEVFLGTLAERIINQSTVPVLAIPESAKYKGIQKILFLAELEKLEMDKFSKICLLADTLGASIEVLQVKPYKEDNEVTVLAQWKERFKNDNVHFTIIHSNATEDMIMDYIELYHIDVSATIVHYKDLWQRLFLFSLSRNLAYHTTIPLLAIPS